MVGYLLLRVLGPKRLVGAWILETFGVKMVMTWWSAIFATIVVIFPLMYRTVRGAFEAFDETLAYSGKTLGFIFWRIRLPYCRQGILASKPKAILLDEPFSALDGYLKWSLEAELSELLSDFSGPIVWVSHDLVECRRNCERVCVMENGTSGKQMDPADLIRKPDSVSAARLAGHINFVQAVKTDNGCAEIPPWGLTLSKVLLENHEATVCIPQSAIDFSGKAYTWRVRRVIEDVNHAIVLLAPENAAQDAGLLRAELPLQNAPKVADALSFSLAEEEVLVYKMKKPRRNCDFRRGIL